MKKEHLEAERDGKGSGSEDSALPRGGSSLSHIQTSQCFFIFIGHNNLIKNPNKINIVFRLAELPVSKIYVKTWDYDNIVDRCMPSALHLSYAVPVVIS